MREMKDSGIEYIGRVPSCWEVCSIKRYYKLITGFTPDTKKEEYYSDDSGEDWVTIGDIQSDGTIPKRTKKRISQRYIDLFHPEKTPKGSLLYSFKLSVGQTAFTDRPTYTNEAIASFVPSANLCLPFLRYSSSLIIENANTNIYGARILNQDLIKNAPVTYPSIEEQVMIASYLDAKCAIIDAIIANQQAQIEKLKQYKQSLITEVVTKGLDPNVPLKDSGIEWIGEINQSFAISTIRSIFQIKKEIIGHEPETVLSITQRGLKIKDVSINEGQMAGSYDHYQIVNVGDFAMNHMDLLTGGVGISQYDGVTSPDYRVFKMRSKTMNPKYFLYVLEMYYRNKIFYAFGQGAANIGRWRLPAQNFNAIWIPVAPLEEQNRIVDFLDKKSAAIEVLITKKTEKIAALNQYKKSLIYEYVTGKKEVL